MHSTIENDILSSQLGINSVSGCLDKQNIVNTLNGIKTIGDLTYDDKILTPNGYKRILYIKDYDQEIWCTQVGFCFLTLQHLTYGKGLNREPIMAKDMGSKVLEKNMLDPLLLKMIGFTQIICSLVVTLTLNYYLN